MSRSRANRKQLESQFRSICPEIRETLPHQEDIARRCLTLPHQEDIARRLHNRPDDMDHNYINIKIFYLMPPHRIHLWWTAIYVYNYCLQCVFNSLQYLNNSHDAIAG